MHPNIISIIIVLRNLHRPIFLVIFSLGKFYQFAIAVELFLNYDLFGGSDSLYVFGFGVELGVGVTGFLVLGFGGFHFCLEAQIVLD